MKLTQQLVQDLLEYHPDTGRFFWKNRDRFLFDRDQDWKRWNKRFAGKQAFTSISHYGYHQSSIFGKVYKAHRIAWLWMMGDPVPLEIDHVNHVRSDNRWENLEASSSKKNKLNLTTPKHNKTGKIGVAVFKDRYSAQVQFKGKKKHLGLFNSVEEADSVVSNYRKHLGFSEHHGE